MTRAGLIASLLLMAAPAHAQLTLCALPAVLPLARPEPVSKDQRKLVPIGGYTLALSWSPERCQRPNASDAFQCEGRRNQFGFVLHGLWPDGTGKDWPQYCRPQGTLSPNVIRANLCMTPSVRLLQNEWARHGTCMARTPERYFAQGRGLFGKVQFPDMTRLMGDDRLTVARFTTAFAAANSRLGKGFSERSVRVRLDRDGWLEEVWLCLNTRLRYTDCRNSQTSGSDDAKPVRIHR